MIAAFERLDAAGIEIDILIDNVGIQANAIGPGYMLTEMNRARDRKRELRQLGEERHPRPSAGVARTNWPPPPCSWHRPRPTMSTDRSSMWTADCSPFSRGVKGEGALSDPVFRGADAFTSSVVAGRAAGRPRRPRLSQDRDRFCGHGKVLVAPAGSRLRCVLTSRMPVAVSSGQWSAKTDTFYGHATAFAMRLR